jgi:hypothetical protein
MSAEFDVGVPIDVDILDHNGQVVFTRPNIAPGDIPILIAVTQDDPPLAFTFDDLIYCFWSFRFSDMNANGASFFDQTTGDLLAVGRTMVARETVPETVVVNDALITGQNLQPVNIHAMTFEVVPEPSGIILGIAAMLITLRHSRRVIQASLSPSR